ncbi:MAG TPA: hypothetical protein VNS80_09240, partial [Pseudolysinimonas sp.]|nr:hypothetical protein [Pseudolysinimonas sp.]
MMTTSARRITAMAALATVGGTLGALLVATPAFAVPYTVTNGASSGLGSFKQAIINANLNPGADTIAFNFLAPTSQLNLTEALPTITETVTITGPGRTALTVNTAGGAPGLQVNGDTTQLTISGLTFETTAPDAGTGIELNEANFVATDLHVRGYPASGLVGDDANVVATDSLFTDNGDVGISWHGDNTDAELEGLSLQRVDLTNNSYGALLDTNGSTGGITFAQVEASRNIFDGVQISGSDFGPILFDGGQYNDNTNGIDLDLDSVTDPNLVLIQNGTQINTNDGTGLVADLDSVLGLLVIGATITGNGAVSPQEGGGIRYAGDTAGLLVQQSTVSNNAATAGGGVYVSSLVGPGAVVN